MKRKFLAFLLAFVMIAGMLPMTALAAEGEEPTTTGVITIKKEKQNGDGDNVIAPTDSMLWLNGGSYQLAEDIDVACFGGASGNKGKVTIDLSGHKITQNSSSEYATCYVDNDLPELEIKNTADAAGSIVANNQYATIQVGGSSAKVTIGENVTLTKTQSRADNSAFAIAVTADATGTPTIDLNGCTINDVNGITVNGLCAGNPKITLNGVTITATGTGIYQAGPSDISDVSVKNSSITGGDLGIEVRAGKLTLENSTIKGGNGNYAVNANGGGTTTSNAAVAVSQHTTAKDIVVTLSGSVKCEATAALSLANPQNNTTGKVEFNVSGGEYKGEIKVAEDLTNAELVITGGTFSVDPSTYVPTTHKVTANTEESIWTVAEKEPVTAPAVTFSIPTSVNLGGEKRLVNEAVAKLEVGTNNVIKVPTTLTADYIQKWTEFNGTDVSEQNGNYLPLKITLAGEATKDSIAKVEVIGSKTKTWTNDGTNFNFFTEDEGKSETLIMQLNKLVGNAGEDKTGPADGHFKIVITPKVDEGETAQATTYDIDCTGVTLKLPASPEKTENQDGSAEIKFEDEADKKQEAANVTNIINAVKAPNKTDDSAEGVETTHNTATIAYDVTTTGTTGAATGTVTLPSDVAKALQQDGETDKVDVKVDIVTDAATVTLSTEAIGKLSKDNDTAIKAEPKTKSDVGSISDASSAALVEHIDNGVDVTVKANNADLITSSSPLPDEGALEITMKVKATSGNVHILYLNASNAFELIGTYPVDANGCVTFKVKHLCEFYEVASNSTTDPLVANLTKSENTPKSLELTIGTTGAFRTATVTNLAANGKCTVQVCREADAAPAVILVLDANASGTATFQVNAGSVVTVWKGEVTFDASGAPSDSTLEHVTKTA